MAREQGLSPNPSKITGVCGRLMCCLAYENDVYKQLRKGLPKVGSMLKLGEIEARVLDVNVLQKKILLSYDDEEAPGGRKVEWIEYHRKSSGD